MHKNSAWDFIVLTVLMKLMSVSKEPMDPMEYHQQVPKTHEVCS